MPVIAAADCGRDEESIDRELVNMVWRDGRYQHLPEAITKAVSLIRSGHREYAELLFNIVGNLPEARWPYRRYGVIAMQARYSSWLLQGCPKEPYTKIL